MLNSEPEEIKKPEKNRKLLSLAVGAIVVLFVIIVSFGIGLELGKKKGAVVEIKNIPAKEAVIINKEKSGDNVIDFSLFWEVWDLLREKFVDADKLDANKLFFGAINGMLRATGDPYTVFFNPEENKKFNEDISGSFDGIGAEIGIKGGVLTIIAPLKDSPAEKAGVRAGDKVLKIDGNSTMDISIDDAIDKIRGAKGTNVILTIFRNGDKETREITVTRDTINVKSTELEFKENGSIAHIELNRFGQETTGEFRKIANEIIAQKAQGIILDMRNNPGGFLDVSVELASKMLPKEKTVVIEEDSDGKQKKLPTEGGDILSGIETVVLINEGSASASEILAGALKDNRENVTLVGKKSFGKGSVQELVTLPRETAVKITVAKWLTPNGKQINNEGITPDVDIDLTDDDYENDRDPQLDKAIEILKEKAK